MKYCQHCGAQLLDEAVICPSCGCPVETRQSLSDQKIIRTIAKVFMLLSCIGCGFFIIPLLWMIPMTVHYWKSVDNNTPVTLGFKICSLIFVNPISGVLMLCDTEEKQNN